MTEHPQTLQEPPGEPEPERVLLHMPVDVRSLALGVMALLAVLYTLRWASAVFIPLLLGVMFSYALSPAVDRLERWRMPRPLSAALLILAVLAALGTAAYRLSDDTTALIETLPAAAQKLRQTLQAKQAATPAAAIEKVQKAATQLERAAEESSRADLQARQGVTRVQIEKPRFDIRDYLVSGTLSLLALGGQLLVVCFIAYFLLASGNVFRRKLVKIAGPSLSKKKITLQILSDIDDQIERFLMVEVLTSIVVGVSTWLAFRWIGLEQAGVWGLLAGIFNSIPYFGPFVVTAGTAAVAFLQFGNLHMALIVSGVSLVI
ncbi:MAG TPA: AI-2E family transporter, partial [Albitalea sp.]|nr:AI-2E family transporter [Albitalea sp.]